MTEYVRTGEREVGLGNPRSASDVYRWWVSLFRRSHQGPSLDPALRPRRRSELVAGTLWYAALCVSTCRRHASGVLGVLGARSKTKE